MEDPLRTIAQRVDDGPRDFESLDLPRSTTTCDEPDHKAPVPNPNTDYCERWDATTPQGEALRNYRPKVLSMWMRKGGVGKSSSTNMLAHSLATNGFRTMTVDCDSQQDLTERMFQFKADEAGEDVEDYLRNQLSQVGHGVARRSVASLSEAVRFVLDMEQVPQGLRAPASAPGYLLKPHPFPVRDNLWHLPGGRQFEEMEKRLGAAMANMLTPNPDRNKIGALFHCIWNAGFAVDAQVILMDLSPALSDANQLLLCHSDFFITPCEVTKLCEKNLRSIPHAFGEWYRAFQPGGPNGNACTGFDEMTRGLHPHKDPLPGMLLPLPSFEPKFLGILLTKYDVSVNARKRNAEGVLVNTAERFKSHRHAVLASKLIRASQRVSQQLSRDRPGNGYAVDPSVFGQPGPGLGEFRHPVNPLRVPQPYLLGRIRKGTQLFESALTNHGVPVSCLQEEHLNGLNNTDAQREEVAHFRRCFQDLARFIQYLDLDGSQRFNFASVQHQHRWDDDMHQGGEPDGGER